MFLAGCAAFAASPEPESGTPDSAAIQKQSAASGEKRVTGKERKERKYFVSKKKTAENKAKAAEQDSSVDFFDSEDGFWNARTVNDPQFIDGGSVNSVMFESRPGRKVKEIPSGPVRQSDVDIVGGKSTEIVVNGRQVNIGKDGRKADADHSENGQNKPELKK